MTPTAPENLRALGHDGPPDPEAKRRERRARRQIERRRTLPEARQLERLFRLHRRRLFGAIADIAQLQELIRHEINVALARWDGRTPK
jgi:hypothetical protein